MPDRDPNQPAADEPPDGSPPAGAHPGAPRPYPGPGQSPYGEPPGSGSQPPYGQYGQGGPQQPPYGQGGPQQPYAPAAPQQPYGQGAPQQPYGQYGPAGPQQSPPYGQAATGHPQPPYGQQPAPSSAYPQQVLSDQEVQPGRNRKPLAIALAVALLVALGGVGAYLLLRDDGESSRAAYCAKLKEVTNGGDISGLAEAADGAGIDTVQEVADLAPSAVADDWRKLLDLAQSQLDGAAPPDVTTFLGAYSALRSIVNDSNDNCGTDFQLPGL